MDDNRIIIIGAGPAGLAAAYEFIRSGNRVTILESHDRVGGISRTESYRNFYFDIGGHRFFTKIEKINGLWKEMMGDDFIKVSRMSRIFYRDRFFNYPLEVFNVLINLGIIESIRIPLSYISTQLRPHRKEDTFEQWVSNRFGRRLYETFFRTYTEKVWGIACHKIRADWAAQRIKGLSLVAAVVGSLLKDQSVKTLINEFDYPLRGPGMMWQRFQEAITEAGGRVLLNSEATCLTHENGAIAKVQFLKDNKVEEMPAGHLISTLPVPALVSMLRPEPPEKVRKAAEGLSYRSFLIVILILNRKHLFPDQWLYIHDPGVRVGRIQNFKNWSAAMVPDPAKTSLGMEYFCNKGDDLWNMPDKDLADMASGELKKLGLAEADDVMDSHVVRQSDAYPVYDEGYRDKLKILKGYLAGIRNLQTIGRGGTHHYNNMDHSMLTGILAVENYFGSSHDLWDVNEEKEYLEEDRKALEVQGALENILDRTFVRMNKFAFATAVGTVSGLLIFLATIWLVIKGGEVVGPNMRLLGQYFTGYTVSASGSFIAFGYSFFWGFLFGWLFAYLRNFSLSLYIFWVRKKTEILTLRDFIDYL